MADINIRIGADLSQLSKDLKKAERQLKRSGERLKSIGSELTMALSVPFAALGGAALQSFADIEKFTNGLTSMMGSAEAAADEMERLKEIAKAPGLDLSQAVKGSVRLQSVGVAAADAREVLAEAGNAIALVGGSSDDLDGVTLALQQIGSKGKVFAEEINQINERLPQIRKAMKDAFGTANTEEIQAMGITSQQFIAGITQELGKLPRATGGMANSFNNARQAVVQALAEIGASIEENFNISGRIDAISNSLLALSDGFANLSPNVQKAVFAFGGLLAAVGPLTFAFGQLKVFKANLIGLSAILVSGVSKLTVVFSSLKMASLSLNAALLANPFVAVGAAVAALAAGLVVLYKRSETFRNGVNQLFDNIKGAFAVVRTVGREILMTLQSVMRTALSVGRSIADVFAAVGNAIGHLIKRIPVVGRTISFLQDVFFDVFNAIKKMFYLLPAIFAGIVEEVKNMGLQLRAFFRRIAISAEVLSKKIQRGITIDSDARKELKASIQRLEKEKSALKEVGEKFGVAFKRGFNDAMSGALGSVVQAKKAIVSEAPTGGDVPTSPTSGAGGAKETTKAIQEQSAATYDLSQLQMLQNLEMTKAVEPLKRYNEELRKVQTSGVHVKSSLENMALAMNEFNDKLTDVVNQGMNDMIVGFSEMMGSFAAGEMSLGDVGKGILSIFAGVMGQVGQLAIQTGVAVAGVKLALKSLNPAVAIAGGAALVALSKFVGAKLNSLGSGGGASSGVGSVGGGGDFYKRFQTGQRRSSERLVTEIDGRKLRLVLQQNEIDGGRTF